jgi:hypothetical protein
MAITRFKILVTGILVAGCLSLGAVSGLYSNASGQHPYDPNPYRYPGFQPPAKDPELQKAQAEYEKAKFDFEKAAEEYHRKWAAARAVEKQAGKFGYVPVPKEGFTVEEFEKKIAEQEQKGWSYSGEATIRNDQGTGRMLVFRNKAWTPDGAPEKPEGLRPSTTPLRP